MDDVYMDRVLSGDVEAFSYFIKTYKNMAFNIAYSIVKDKQYAEEVTQDAFMKAFNGLKKFNRTATFKSWFYRVVVNESFLRLRVLKKRHSIFSVQEQSDDILKDHIEEVTETHTEKINEVLLLLDAKESLAIELFYLQELSINDIVKITGWSIANTKVILHRARKNIRHIWKNH